MRTRYRIAVALVAAALVLAALAGLLLRRAPGERLYRVTILPTLGGQLTTPTAINNRGQIAGYSETADGRCWLCLWDPNGRIQVLGPAVRTRYYLNDAGQIAGTMLGPGGNETAFLWDRAQGVRWLGTLGGGKSMARAVNNRGQVVGWSLTAEGRRHAFVWDPTMGMQDVDPSQREGTAQTINDSGLIIVDGQEGPSLWTADGPTRLAALTFGMVGFSDMNARGYTACEGLDSSRGKFLVLWRHGATQRRLFLLEHPIEQWPMINDANQILLAEWHRRPLEGITAGRVLASPIENYLWDPNRGRIRLDVQVPVKKSETLELFDLNNRGCLVGRITGRKWTGGITSVRPVLLEPIPERWRK